MGGGEGGEKRQKEIEINRLVDWIVNIVHRNNQIYFELNHFYEFFYYRLRAKLNRYDYLSILLYFFISALSHLIIF